MIYLLFFIAFAASILGAATGIGGGIIIKPAVDALGILPVTVASFLSGCTVLSMSCVSLINSRKRCRGPLLKKAALLGVGAAVGGVLGKLLFDMLAAAFPHSGVLAAAQSSMLLVLTAGVIVYLLNKHRIITHNIENKAYAIFTGLVLGVISSFLGIGGGPFNLAVLYYLFSLEAKDAAVGSLFIIMLSQSASIFFTVASGNVPAFDPVALVAMITAGVLGGILGSELLKRSSAKGTVRLFMGVLCLIIAICIYNILRSLIAA
ncbi:MAG: sulfite exporter TauE/SafE family protein [Christensenellales bacterium]|jgi:uncharacterized membrane protein YfcA